MKTQYTENAVNPLYESGRGASARTGTSGARALAKWREACGMYGVCQIYEIMRNLRCLLLKLPNVRKACEFDRSREMVRNLRNVRSVSSLRNHAKFVLIVAKVAKRAKGLRV